MTDDNQRDAPDQRDLASGGGKRPWYSISLFFVFILPFIFLFKTILKNVQRKPFFWSIGLICVLGWAWSMILSYTTWWVFPKDFILGIYVLPYVPLEEFLIYPLGGAFSIFVYTFSSRRLPRKCNAAVYWSFISLVTLLFVVLAVVKRDSHPYYLYSQFALYNALCFLLAPLVAKDVNLPGLFVSVFALGSVGFVWDYFAFKFGWWVYNAITQVKVIGIPVEDFNFYSLATVSAIVLYVLFCRRFAVSQFPAKTE